MICPGWMSSAWQYQQAKKQDKKGEKLSYCQLIHCLDIGVHLTLSTHLANQD